MRTSLLVAMSAIIAMFLTACSPAEPQVVTETVRVTETPEPVRETVTPTPSPATVTETVTAEPEPPEEESVVNDIPYTPAADVNEESERAERLGEYPSEDLLMEARMTISLAGVQGVIEEPVDEVPGFAEHAVEATIPACINIRERTYFGYEEWGLTAELLQELWPVEISHPDALVVSMLTMISATCPTEASALFDGGSLPQDGYGYWSN